MIRTMRVAQAAALLTLTTLLLTNCNTAPHAAAADSATHARGMQPAADPHAAHGAIDGDGREGHGTEGVAPASAFSIYDLEATWQDQQATTLQLGDLAGRPRIVALVYTSCAYACPRILKDMKLIEGELRAAGVDAGYVMVSVDPARDTPQRLNEYAASTMLDAQDWTLLTGTEDGTLELAALLGVRYRQVSDTDFEHSNVITLLDAEGRIVQQQVGLNSDPAELIRAATTLR